MAAITHKESEPEESARLITEEIKSFINDSPLNRLPDPCDGIIFDEPLVQFAEGNDHIFKELKKIIHPGHLTPREALGATYNLNPENTPDKISVISWILPIAEKTRKSNHHQFKNPSRLWAYTRYYGEKLNEALRQHVVNILTGRGFMATAPVSQPYFKVTLQTRSKAFYSNWSERHVAYVAGLGTFSLTDSFITERGIAHRCGSVVTDVNLPASPRTATSLYANCLFYINGTCRACMQRCPVGAITEKGHDKSKCYNAIFVKHRSLNNKYGVGIAGCGLCQTMVPCEDCNPAKKLQKKTR